MGEFSTIQLQTDDRGVARLTLNRPEARNALSQEMIDELRTACKQLVADDRVRVVVLTGAGEIFCAGGDLKGMATQAQGTRESRVADATSLAELLAEMNNLAKPLIGRINGPAYGGGVGLVSVCDLAIGVDTARLRLTEVRLGLIPATISPYVVARLGVPAARRVMLNATDMSAAMAFRLGLLSEAVPAGELDAAVNREVQLFLECAPGAVARCKELIRYVSTHDQQENIHYTAQRLADCWETAEIQEGIQAFMTKRKPAWHISAE